MVHNKPIETSATMSDYPTPEEWPPNDLITDLSLTTSADPETELDDRVESGTLPDRFEFESSALLD